MKKILIVEDDPVNARVLSELLAAHGYAPIVATTGPEGLERFRDEQPDLVIADVLLPGRTGLDVCFELKRTARGRATPLFLMSAVLDDISSLHRDERPETRAQAYFVKPFDIDTLLDNVRFYLAA